jgi:hypothetical protein
MNLTSSFFSRRLLTRRFGHQNFISVMSYSNMILFVIGFIILNVLFHIPYLGGIMALVSLSVGFGAVLYAARNRLGSKEIAKSVS